MSQYYNPMRASSWNYGGSNWKLSRSKIDLFLECPRCFYLDNKLGLKRVPGFPFSLNSAVDHLLKKEFDFYRQKGEPHPIQQEAGLDIRPVFHEELEEWRKNFGGIVHLHRDTNLLVSGAIDDLWINNQGEYLVVDYKSTAKEEAVKELDQDWQDTYKRQMEVYQWLLRQKGLKVSNSAYFVYCTGDMSKDSFNQSLDFEINLIEYLGNDNWVEETLFKIKDCLENDEIPSASSDCDHCAYWTARRKFEK